MNASADAAAAMRAHCAMLARYNVWATERLLGQVEALPDADYRRDCGLYFRSVHGTLNHLLVGEHLVWFPRFAEGVSPMVALNSEAEPDRARLAEQLRDGAARWAPFIAGLPAARFAGVLEYTTLRGVRAVLPFTATLAHVYNHGTHHRGQISAALTAMGRECPELDLVYMLQKESAPT